MALKKYPSRAMAYGMRAPLMMVPFGVTSIDRAIPADTIAAPHSPTAIAVASDAGRGEAAMLAAGSTYCTAAFVNIYSTATMPTPAISAIGMVRSGRRISPLTMFRSFHPSYAHKAATSAAMKPATPPVAPVKCVPKLRHVPLAAVNPITPKQAIDRKSAGQGKGVEG